MDKQHLDGTDLRFARQRADALSAKPFEYNMSTGHLQCCVETPFQACFPLTMRLHRHGGPYAHLVRLGLTPYCVLRRKELP